MESIFKIKLSQILVLFFTCFIGVSTFLAQTTIAIQSFEASGDTWTPMSLSQPSCDGVDTWGYRSASLGGISPNHLSQFWGIHDLDGTCNGSLNQFETITLPNVDVSLYNSVTFSFDYNVVGFDGGDDLKYELFYDNVSQGEVVVVSGSSNYSTSGWVTETVTVPNTVTNVSVVLSAKQNGNSDYGGFDKVILEGTSTCTPATISNVSPTSGPEGSTVTITASSGDLTGGSVSFNGVAATITSSNTTTIVCTVPAGATSGDLTIVDSQPCTSTYSTFTVTCGPTTEPTSSSSALNFSTVDCQNFTINWTNGNGANRIVVMSTSSIAGVPADQTAYTANSTFGSGSILNAGEYVVYNGSGNSVTVTGLTVNTNYFVSVFEYNGTTANCTENYLTSTNLTGSQMTLSACATCPQVKSILVNACGPDEGLNEYIVFKNGSNSLSVDDIQIDFPSAGSYCNTACGTKTIINNATYTSNLNAIASCSKFIYADPISANATVIVFTSTSPSYNYDFSSLCSISEQVVVLYCNSTSTTGRFSNSSSTVRNTTLTWGACTQTAGYIGSSTSGADGDFADFDAAGAVSYSNIGSCIAGPLPVEINYFEANKNVKGVQLDWETWSEIDADYYELLKSFNGIDYELLGIVEASGFSNEIINYTSIDTKPFSGVSYYQLNLVNFNGVKEVLGNAVFNYSNSQVSIFNYNSYWQVKHNAISEGVINIYGINGVLLSSVSITDFSTQVSNAELPNGIYIVEVKSDEMIWITKVVK